MANPTPPVGATTTTLQVGTYTALTDAFTLVLDLNDHATFFLHPQGLKLDQPEKIFSRGNNIRTPGETIARSQYKNRKIQASIWIGRKLSYAQLSAAWRSLIQAVERPPYVLRLALPGASAYSYADVVAVTHNIPADPQLILNGTVMHIEVTFECKPFLRGDRLTLSNLVPNPGFEAPSGPGVTVFSDPLNNFNAYSVVAGGALSLGTTTYADVVLGDSPLRYYRLDETSGTSAADATGSGNNGTYTGGYTQGQTGALTGDSDTAAKFNGTSGYVNLPTTGLPTGTSAWSLEVWVKLAALPTTLYQLAGWGTIATSQGALIYLDTSGLVHGGPVNAYAASTSALSLNTWHHIVATYSGGATGTTTLYVDGASVGTATPGTAANLTLGYANLAVQQSGASSFTYYTNGTLDEVAIYGTALSAQQVAAHYNAGHNGPTANAANTMVVPSGGTVTFGSSAWGAINSWQVFTRAPVSGQTITYMLHRTDANNWLGAQLAGNGATTTLALVQTVGGTAHTLASGTVNLGPGCRYWLQVTQFPTVAGSAAQVQAVLLTNNAAIGFPQTQIATVGPSATYDAVTALVGVAALSATGGGAYLGSPIGTRGNTVALFGPGNWVPTDTLSGGAPTPCAYAWEQSTANTLAAGPMTSFGAGRMDLPSAGTYNAAWYAGSEGPSNLAASCSPVANAGDTLGVSVWVRTSAGVTANCTQQVGIDELDANGNVLRTGSPSGMSRTGPTNQGSNGGWTQLSGTYTTGTGCVYVCLWLSVRNTVVAGADGGQTVWWDNAQLWDQTATGQTSMPYCELRFPQSPAQLMVSGVVGDVPAPAFLAAGVYQASFAAGTSVGLLLGRAAYALRGAQFVGADGTVSQTTVLSSAAYSGYYVNTSAATGSRRAVPVCVTPAQVRGQFHLLARTQTGQSTSGGQANVSVRVRATQEIVPWNSGTSVQIDEAEYYTTYLYPLTSTNWMTADAGYLPLPCFPLTSLGDPAQTYYQPGVEITDGNASKQYILTNWGALVPVDASVLTVTLNNPGNTINTPSNSWEWLYVDGLQALVTGQAALNWSLETVPSPNAAHAYGGQVAQSAGPINLFSSGDPFLTLDPAPLSIAGDTAAAAGVNQFCGLMANASNNSQVLPLYVELQYSPRYLYPR